MARKTFPAATRRAILKGAAASLATHSFAAPAIAAVQPARRQPNILFILADDLGYADVSCYGRREYETRHIDQLAATGLRFTDG